MNLFTKLTAAFAVASMATLAQANLLDDGNLSLADSGAQTSNSDWVLTVNFPDTVDDAAQFQTGFANAQNTGVGGTEAPGTGTGVWFKSFEGLQAPGDALAQADLSQSVVAPNNGDYVLTFVASREANFSAGSWDATLSSSGTGGSASIDLLVAALNDGNLGSAASAGGTPLSLTLAGVSAGDTLTVSVAMVNGVDAQTNPQSAFVDSFNLVQVVPEPASAGVFGVLVGFAAMRRRRNARA